MIGFDDLIFSVAINLQQNWICSSADKDVAIRRQLLYLHTDFAEVLVVLHLEVSLEASVRGKELGAFWVADDAHLPSLCLYHQ